MYLLGYLREISYRLVSFSIFRVEMQIYIILIFMCHSLLWRHIVLLTVGVYSSKHRVLYTIGIGMTRRFQKSVGPSVRPSVRL